MRSSWVFSSMKSINPKTWNYGNYRSLSVMIWKYYLSLSTCDNSFCALFSSSFSRYTYFCLSRWRHNMTYELNIIIIKSRHHTAVVRQGGKEKVAHTHCINRWSKISFTTSYAKLVTSLSSQAFAYQPNSIVTN